MTRFFYGMAVLAMTMYVTLIPTSSSSTIDESESRVLKTSATATAAATTRTASSSFQLAAHDSFGFFTDITDANWKIRKRITHEALHHVKNVGFELPMSSPRAWYQNNWNEDFSCLLEVGVGGIADGHKFMCDPHRLSDNKLYQNDCLIYSFGSNGNFDFERAINQLAPHCEIHVFDPDNYESHMREAGIEATYHAIGLASSYESSIVDMTLAERIRDQDMKTKYDYKTFPEILEELGHGGRRIDVFKIDCEGCEYRTYKDWIVNDDVDIRQVVVEVHNFPSNTNEFFQDFYDQGYVIFHKEPNIEWSGGNCVEFAFLKLHKDFFEHHER